MNPTERANLIRERFQLAADATTREEYEAKIRKRFGGEEQTEFTLVSPEPPKSDPPLQIPARHLLHNRKPILLSILARLPFGSRFPFGLAS